MPWIIDHDFEPEASAAPGTNGNAVGLTGPRGYQGNGDELTFRFRLYDDDGNLYYEGRSHSDSSFAPLDDFGAPNAGATTIKYFNKRAGKWEIL